MSGTSPNAPNDAPIAAYDELGRPVFVPRSQWADEVLPESLLAAWNEPDRLRMHILVALEDGFAELLLSAAVRLSETDPKRERGAAILALVEIENGRPADAAATLRQCLEAVE